MKQKFILLIIFWRSKNSPVKNASRSHFFWKKNKEDCNNTFNCYKLLLCFYHVFRVKTQKGIKKSFLWKLQIFSSFFACFTLKTMTKLKLGTFKSKFKNILPVKSTSSLSAILLNFTNEFKFSNFKSFLPI